MVNAGRAALVVGALLVVGWVVWSTVEYRRVRWMYR
jgi:hypothetical protein